MSELRYAIQYQDIAPHSTLILSLSCNRISCNRNVRVRTRNLVRPYKEPYTDLIRTYL